MAFLTPDRVYTEHGLKISEKLITASSGVRYYSGKKLETPDHKPAYVTIHNTADINEAAGTNDAEQYARATFNNNMGDVVVHYYIDESGCWHILADDTVGWHAASHNGNYTSVAIEIIMDGSGDSSDKGAEDRGALLAAILLNRYGLGIERLTTHNYWYPKKYCPCFILPHWSKFVKKVGAYLNEIEAETVKNKTEAQTKIAVTTIYYVQVGSFASQKNAAAYAEKVKKMGFPAIVKTAKVLGVTYYRVQIGAFGVKKNADEQAAKAKAAGLSVVVRKG